MEMIEHEMKLRVKFDTEREFAVERKLIDDDPSISRAEIREAILSCSAAERRVLKSRLRKRLQRIDELMATPRKTFEEPLVTTEDLQDGVHLSNEMLS
jgi:type II secretory pathway predicted ATPase ExeA